MGSAYAPIKRTFAKELEATINEMFVHYKDAIKTWILGWMLSKVKADIAIGPRSLLRRTNKYDK